MHSTTTFHTSWIHIHLLLLFLIFFLTIFPQLLELCINFSFFDILILDLDLLRLFHRQQSCPGLVSCLWVGEIEDNESNILSGLCFCDHSHHSLISCYCFSTHQQPHLPTNTLRLCQKQLSKVVTHPHVSASFREICYKWKQLDEFLVSKKLLMSRTIMSMYLDQWVHCCRQLEYLQHHSKAVCVLFHYNCWDSGYEKCDNSSHIFELIRKWIEAN